MSEKNIEYEPTPERLSENPSDTQDSRDVRTSYLTPEGEIDYLGFLQDAIPIPQDTKEMERLLRIESEIVNTIKVDLTSAKSDSCEKAINHLRFFYHIYIEDHNQAFNILRVLSKMPTLTSLIGNYRNENIQQVVEYLLAKQILDPEDEIIEKRYLIDGEEITLENLGRRKGTNLNPQRKISRGKMGREVLPVIVKMMRKHFEEGIGWK
jgi:hypothetical protein